MIDCDWLYFRLVVFWIGFYLLILVLSFIEVCFWFYRLCFHLVCLFGCCFCFLFTLCWVWGYSCRFGFCVYEISVWIAYMVCCLIWFLIFVCLLLCFDLYVGLVFRVCLLLVISLWRACFAFYCLRVLITWRICFRISGLCGLICVCVWFVCDFFVVVHVYLWFFTLGLLYILI